MNSPFAEGRFEHDATHLYYLPQHLFSALEQPKPTFLIGTRGSGKTTLLKALNWKERQTNSTLLRQLGNDAYRGLFIGTYVKLPKIQLTTFDFWLREADEDRHGQIVGFYLDLIYLQLISRAVSDMLAEGHLRIPSSDEAASVATWLEGYEKLVDIAATRTPRSVTSFAEVVSHVRLQLELASRTRRDLNEVFEDFPIQQIGDLSSTVSPKIADLCGHDRQGQEGKWHFKVCMDEGECLTSFQQKVINTQIRLSEWPLFPIVSYVGRPEDITTTLIPQLTHQKADRQLLVIDTLERAEFKELAEGVASVRCQETLGSVDASFSTTQTLGALNVNGLLKTIIDRSESPKRHELLTNAESFAGQFAEPPDVLPIWEAYLSKTLGLETSPTTSDVQSRYVRSREYRKKFVAAYLSICRELRVRNVPYAGAEMVLRISDNCVRDFLSQIDHVFQRSGLSVEAFISNEVPVDVQIEALRAASEEKRDSIPESGVLAPVETGRVVKGLAEITALIQSSSGDNRHLRSTERGLFRFADDGDREQVTDALRLVADAAEAGFLRLYEEGDNVRFFRVHASLAPAYGFSYRGAYYAVELSVSDFEKLKQADTDKEINSTARAIAQAMPGEIDMPLFPNLEGENDG